MTHWKKVGVYAHVTHGMESGVGANVAEPNDVISNAVRNL